MIFAISNILNSEECFIIYNRQLKMAFFLSILIVGVKKSCAMEPNLIPSNLESLARHSEFYDRNNPFFNANILLHNSRYREAQALYEELLGKLQRQEITATSVQMANAHLNHAQATWATQEGVGAGVRELHNNLGRTGTRPGLKKPLPFGVTAAQVRGKRILVRSTDGLGDTVSRIRDLKALKDAGATVIVKVQGPLKTSVERCTQCVDAVMKNGDDDPGFDYDMYLLGAPNFTSNDGVVAVRTAGDIPRDQAYFKPYSDTLVAKWANLIRANGKRPFGVVWAASSNPVPGGRILKRNIPLKLLARIGQKLGAKLYSLQGGGHKPITQRNYDELDEIDQKERACDLISGDQVECIHEFDKDFDKPHAFEDTIAFMKATHDAGGHFIGVDTCGPNLAGALGVRTLALLDKNHDARWGEPTPGAEAIQNRYFDSVREFHQGDDGDWNPVVDNVIKYLKSVD